MANSLLLTQIDEWLSSKYLSEEIPVFERTEEACNMLQELLRMNEAQDNHAQEAILALQQLSTSYQSEDIVLQETLQILGIQKTLLSNDTRSLLSQLSDLAMLLGVSDMTPASFQLGLARLNIDNVRVMQKRKLQHKRSAALERTRIDAQRKLDSLLELKRQWTKQRETKGDLEQRTRRRSTELNRIKTAEDRETLVALQHKRQSLVNSFDPDTKSRELTIAQLDDKERNIADLQQLLDAQAKSLAAYQEIPPDYALAKLKVKEATLRLDELTIEHESLLRQLADDL
ncbi:HAUS augmin-like complex subunit 1 [Mortierella sp. GBA30]|nr:HAUS augmin-like complex subunit 1 [Mortierella sp. GBA30]